jgi:hypothetical protein
LQSTDSINTAFVHIDILSPLVTCIIDSNVFHGFIIFVLALYNEFIIELIDEKSVLKIWVELQDF